MAANDPWWLIGYKPIGDSSKFTFQVFQGTKAAAEARQKLAVNGTLDGPFATRAQAVAAEPGERKKPIPAIGLPPGIPNPLDVFKGLNLQTWALRIGEIALGIVLVAVGLAKLTGADNVISKAAMTAGKAALL